MKTINNSLLLVVFSLLPFFFFSSCSDDESAPMPTVNIEAGDVTDASLTFTVTAVNATKAAWICVKKGETVPAMESILAKGKSVDASKATPVTVSDLEHNTDYVIVVAAEGEGGQVVSAPLNVTTKQKVINIEFTEGSLKTGKDNNFYLRFANSTYELKVDFYTKNDSKYLMPGTYALAGMKEMECDKNYTDLITLAVGPDSKVLFTEGTIEVAIIEGTNTYEVKVNMTTATGELLTAHYKGEIMGMTVVEDTEYKFTLNAAKRTKPNNWIPGEYYLKMNDAAWNVEMTLEFYADPATTELPVGTYALNSSKAPNTIGVASNIDAYDKRTFTTNFEDGSGTIEVTKADKKYTFKINLVNSKGLKYTGSFTGEISNMDLTK